MVHIYKYTFTIDGHVSIPYLREISNELSSLAFRNFIWDYELHSSSDYNLDIILYIDRDREELDGIHREFVRAYISTPYILNYYIESIDELDEEREENVS